jgi:hypothetical protein
MRRTIDEALFALRQQVAAWARGEARPGLRVFVYPPEWEAPMLARFPAFADECAAAGWPISVIDVGTGFLEEIARRPGFEERLAQLEQKGTDQLLNDLGVLGSRYVTRVLKAAVPEPAVCRVLVNAGALATFVSYSAIANALHGDAGDADGAVPCNVLAFPGEDDERSLNLLRLRVDTTYRIPRI